MWYDVKAKIEVSSLPAELPYGCDAVVEGNKTFALIKWSDEGFDSSEFQDVLKLAKRRGTFKVIMSDHKGASSFKVAFGPDFYQEL